LTEIVKISQKAIKVLKKQDKKMWEYGNPYYSAPEVFSKFLVEVAREPVRDFCAQVQKKSWERNAHSNDAPTKDIRVSFLTVLG
jgi:hypothetical protein